MRYPPHHSSRRADGRHPDRIRRPHADGAPVAHWVRGFCSLVVLALPLLSAATSGSAVEVTARTSASSVPLGQTVELTLEANGEIPASPDLSVLDTDFDIVGRRTQHSASVINGVRSETYRLTLAIRPRHTGILKIPAIRVGEATTEPVLVTVTDGVAQQPRVGKVDEGTAAAPEVLVETRLDAPKVWVKQQAVLTAKVFMGSPVGTAQLRDPQIQNATILPLGEDRYTATRDGKDYSVYERRYAIFPQEPGQLHIPPVRFEGWTSGASRAIATPYAYGGQAVQAESLPLHLQVLPAPSDGGGNTWLPARGVTLTESGADTYRASVGDPLQRRITLRVDGIKASDLPAIAIPSPYALVKQSAPPRLWDERRPEGVIGVRQESITLTTDKPGHYRLPPVSLPWWNTKDARWETAMLPARDLVVTADRAADWTFGAGTTTASPGTWSARPDEERPPATAGSPPPADGGRTSTGREGWGAWSWLTVALGLAWIGTMLAWWNSRRRKERPSGPTPRSMTPSEPPEVEPSNDAIAAVRIAYEAENAATAREALLAWAKDVFPENPPSNLARLAQRCNEPLRGHILMLEQTFFSPRPLPWSRQPVWQALGDFEPAPPEEPATFRRAKPLRRRASV